MTLAIATIVERHLKRTFNLLLLHPWEQPQVTLQAWSFITGQWWL